MFPSHDRAGSVTVCRVLAGGGYTYTSADNRFVALAISSSVGVPVITSVIFPSKSVTKPDLSLSSFSGADFNDDFALELKGSTGGSQTTDGKTYSASLNPSNANYLFKQINNDPNNSKTSAIAYNGTPGYAYQNFKQFQTDIAGTSATKEVTVITFPAETVSTSSIMGTAAFGNSIVVTDADGITSTTLAFSGSIGYVTPPGS